MANEILRADRLNFSYDGQRPILKDLTFSIQSDDFIALTGSSGSGKSTFIQHLNGLLKADKGQLFYKGQEIYGNRSFFWTDLRQKVGLVFQYPETQLFKTTVLEDAKYGPLNIGVSDGEAEERAVAALKAVGIDSLLFNANPSELSGGQKRCVAIAGVLAMRPDLLILDEPTAGLDPHTVSLIFDVLLTIHEERRCAILFVSHRMNEIERYAKTMWVLAEGQIQMQGEPCQVFNRVVDLEKAGIKVPLMTQLSQSLIDKGVPLEILAHNEADFFDQIVCLMETMGG